MIARVFRRDKADRAVADLYVTLVEQSRDPAFYLRCGVPDTLDGRFDMIVLHAFLVLDRLRGQGRRAEAFAQALFDHMFADMDVNLREIGVGDLSVGKKVKQMAQAFYGRARAYEEGLAAGGDDTLVAALRRNLYRSTSPDRFHVGLVAAYLRREAARLATTPTDDILGARIEFGPPPVGEPAATDASAASL